MSIKQSEHLQWYEAVRVRPTMYIGGVGSLGVLRVVRGLLDAGSAPTRASVALSGASMEIELSATPPGLVPHSSVGSPFFLMACTYLALKSDEPPSLAQCEVVDAIAGVGRFTRVNQVTSWLAVANATSARFSATTVRCGTATTFVFAGGRLLDGPIEARSTRPTGLRMEFEPDRQIFGDWSTPFHELCELARDVGALRRIPVSVLDHASGVRFEFDGTVA